MGSSVKSWGVRTIAGLLALAAVTSVQAQDVVKIALGMSGWTGFGPLTWRTRLVCLKTWPGCTDQVDSPKNPSSGTRFRSHPMRRHHG